MSKNWGDSTKIGSWGGSRGMAGVMSITWSCRKTQDLLYDVAFNPAVLGECLKGLSLEEMLIALCLDYVENETDLVIPSRMDCKKVYYNNIVSP